MEKSESSEIIAPPPSKKPKSKERTSRPKSGIATLKRKTDQKKNEKGGIFASLRRGSISSPKRETIAKDLVFAKQKPNLSNEPLKCGRAECIEKGFFGNSRSTRYFILSRDLLTWHDKDFDYYTNNQRTPKKGMVDLQHHTFSQLVVHNSEKALTVSNNNKEKVKIICTSLSDLNQWVQAFAMTSFINIYPNEILEHLEEHFSLHNSSQEPDLMVQSVTETNYGGHLSRAVGHCDRTPVDFRIYKAVVTVDQVGVLKASALVPELTQFYREIINLKKLKHENIVSFFGYYRTGVSIYCMRERLTNDLHSLFFEGEKIPTDQQLTIAKDITAGLSYLHDQGYPHKSLTTKSIFITSSGRAKITGFEVGDKFLRESLLLRSQDPPQYTCPESRITNFFKADIFILAIILWELTDGVPNEVMLWPDLFSTRQFQEHYAEGNRPPLVRDSCLSTIIQRCWATEPELRPDASEVSRCVNAIDSFQLRELPDPVLDLSSSLQATNLRPSASEEKKTGIVDRLLKAFVNDSMGWDDFKQEWSAILGCEASRIERLKFIFVSGEPNKVEKSVVISCLSWFPDLNLSEIESICSEKAFFGFVSSTKAESLLKSEPAETYLFRFSSFPGDYAISCSLGSGQVIHWKLLLTSRNPLEFCLENELVGYPSFTDFADAFSSPQNPLISKGASVCLTNPLQKPQDD